MMHLRAFALTSLALVACGEDHRAVTPDAPMGTCTNPSGSMPETGRFTDAYALDLPATCVAGGLADLDGRWFVADPTGNSLFGFAYPAFESRCGHRRVGFVDDHDAS